MDKPVKNQRSLANALALGVIVGISAAAIFAAGFLFRDLVGFVVPTAFAAADTHDSDYPLLHEVQNLLNQHYLREQPAYTQRQYAAIRGVLAVLEDRYTFFIDPPVAQSESDALAGTYGGVGVQVVRNEAGEFVLFPFEDSPAKSSGIEDGDVLAAINGEPLDLSTSLDVVDQMLRGEVKEGSGVELTLRKTDASERTVFIEFAVINVPSVIWRVLSEDKHIGYVQILRFTSRTPDELSEALEALKSARVGALIVDLRNNSGGLLQEAVDSASQFIGDNRVIVLEQSNHSERTFTATHEAVFEVEPLVVLVNQGTASASELLAGAIQDHKRGILIGQRTYGKGTVQQIFRLSDESSVHITSAEWLTPNGRRLEKVGLEPDITMIPDENGRDVEFGEAVRYLQQNYNLE